MNLFIQVLGATTMFASLPQSAQKYATSIAGAVDSIVELAIGWAQAGVSPNRWPKLYQTFELTQSGS